MDIPFRRLIIGASKTGDEVMLTVKGTFTHDGELAYIQASDTVRVIK